MAGANVGYRQPGAARPAPRGRDRRSPPLALQPRQGPLPRGRLHQGPGHRLLHADRARRAAAPARAPADAQALGHARAMRLVRQLAAVVLLPGTVAILIPALLLGDAEIAPWPLALVGGAVLAFGLCMIGWTVALFAGV